MGHRSNFEPRSRGQFDARSTMPRLPKLCSCPRFVGRSLESIQLPIRGSPSQIVVALHLPRWSGHLGLAEAHFRQRVAVGRRVSVLRHKTCPEETRKRRLGPWYRSIRSDRYQESAMVLVDSPPAPSTAPTEAQQRTARIAGWFFVITFVTSIPALLLYQPLLLHW